MKRTLFLIFLFLVLISCKSRDYKDNVKNPEIILVDSIYSYNDADGLLKINAGKIEIWSKEKRRVLEDFKFDQINREDDSLKMSGKSNYAKIYDNSNIVDMLGNIELYIYESVNINSIIAEDLKFNSKSGDVDGKGNFKLYWGGLEVEGFGIHGNIKKGQFNFDRVVYGSL